MRYYLFGLACTSVGSVIGWVLCKLVSREHLKRDMLRQRASDLTQEQVREAWKKEL